MSGTEVLILLAGIGLSVGGVIVVRRIVPQEKLTENNDYAGFTYGILGLIYGIYLAFTVVVVWQQYEHADEQVMQEAAVLGLLWRNAAGFAPAERLRIHEDLITYTRSVLHDEWPRMAPGLQTTASPAYDRIWEDFYRIDPTEDSRGSAFYEASVAGLNNLSIARRMRILSSNASLPLSMWILLVIGAAGTIMFTWFYGTRYLALQVAVTTFLSGLIIYSVLLVAMLEHPFGGTVKVSPRPFQEVLQIFEMRIQAERATRPSPL